MLPEGSIFNCVECGSPIFKSNKDILEGEEMFDKMDCLQDHIKTGDIINCQCGYKPMLGEITSPLFWMKPKAEPSDKV